MATRRRMYAGAHAPSAEGARLTLGEVLLRYRKEGLSSSARNRRKDELRIDEILRDEISARKVASLARPDIAVYRDLLIDRSYARKIERAVAALQASGAPARRIQALRALPDLRDSARRAAPEQAADIERKVLAIEAA